MPRPTNRSVQSQRAAIHRAESGGVSGDALPAQEVTGSLNPDPVTTAALALFELSALPRDRRELDALVAPRDPRQWTWEKTHAWRHLRDLLNTPAPETITTEEPARP